MNVRYLYLMLMKDCQSAVEVPVRWTPVVSGKEISSLASFNVRLGTDYRLFTYLETDPGNVSC